MAITELVFPKVKTDQASLEEIERGWPEFSKILTTPNPGALCAFRGWILTEDGRDVREEHREFLLFGKSHKSDKFFAHLGILIPLMHRVGKTGIIPSLRRLRPVQSFRRFHQTPSLWTPVASTFRNKPQPQRCCICI